MIPALNILMVPFVNLHLTEWHVLFIIPSRTLGLSSESTQVEEATRCALHSDHGAYNHSSIPQVHRVFLSDRFFSEEEVRPALSSR